MNRNSFEEIVKKDYKIFVDTSSLMQKDSDYVFFRIIAPILYKYQKKLIIPKSVYNEISKHWHNNHPNIEIASKILSEMSKFNLIGTNSKFDEDFADNVILAQFQSLRLKYNLCLITNDNSNKKDGNLSQDILDLKKSRAVDNIKDIRVFYIKNKNIVEFKNKTEKSNKQKNKKTDKNYNFQFSLPKKVAKNDRELTISYSPKENDYIIDNNGKKHRLIKQIGRTGGEGSVYLTDSNLICKIYKKEKTTLFRKEKINLLIKHKIKIKNVCLPELIAYNTKNEFVGYLMLPAKGNELKTSIFIPPLLKQKFPNWNRIQLAKVGLNILEKVKALHSHNIIIGDINPSNILVENENNIYFIDTDSFQIESYPCSVGMVPYTKPKHHGKRYESYLRTKNDDMFALATLLFQLMLPGKLPYSYSGGGSEKENMRPENFPYKCYDGKGYNNAPDGQWVYIWSHLPRKLKILFCKVFKKDENININEFIKEMRSYIHQLSQGHQTTDIFPMTYKQIDDNGNVLKDEYQEFICKQCGRKFALTNKQISTLKTKGKKLPTKCNICMKLPDPNLKICQKCGKKFTEKSDNTLCKKCRGIDIRCQNCGTTFFFSDSEKEFYDKKNLTYPKTCKNCRNKKNMNYQQNNTYYTNSNYNYQPNNNNNNSVLNMLKNLFNI